MSDETAGLCGMLGHRDEVWPPSQVRRLFDTVIMKVAAADVSQSSKKVSHYRNSTNRQSLIAHRRQSWEIIAWVPV